MWQTSLISSKSLSELFINLYNRLFIVSATLNGQLKISSVGIDSRKIALFKLKNQLVNELQFMTVHKFSTNKMKIVLTRKIRHSK